jgi:hypothetical protein
MDQLELIYRVCGTPTPETWPGIEKVPLYKVQFQFVFFVISFVF